MKKIKLISIILISLYFLYYISTYTEWHFIDYVNLIFHEAGHTIFFFAGMYLKILAGSGLQIAIPLFITLYFLYNENRFSASLCLMWLGQNILNVSVYIRDAITMQLDLLGGDYVIHDWNYLLSNLDFLRFAPEIASIFYYSGILAIIIGIFSAINYLVNNSNHV